MPPFPFNPMNGGGRIFRPAGLNPEQEREVSRLLDGGPPDTLLGWARSSASSVELLQALGQLPHVEIQRAVAANFSTPPQQLLELGLVYPEEFLDNKAVIFDECFGRPFPPEQTEHIRELAAYRHAIRTGSTPLFLMEKERLHLANLYANTVWAWYLARDPAQPVRIALAANMHGLPDPDVTARQLVDPCFHTRAALAKNPRLDPSLYLKLAVDPALQVRKALAGNASAKCAAAHWNLYEQGESAILLELAANSNLAAELAAALCHAGLQVRSQLAENEKLAHEAIEVLVGYGELPVFLRLAANAGVIEHTVCQLAAVSHPDVQEALAANPKCPPLYLSSLAHQGDERIHLALLSRDELPALIQVHLAAHGSRKVRLKLLRRLLSNRHQHSSPAMSRVCQLLADDPEEEIRIRILHDPRLGQAWLGRRLTRASLEEQRQIASNQSLATEITKGLCLHEDSILSHNALRTLLYKATRLYGILDRGFAGNPEACYRELAVFIAANLPRFTPAQRLLLLGHQHTPLHVLGLFADMPDPAVWDALLMRKFRLPYHVLSEGDGPVEVLPLKKAGERRFQFAHAHSANPYLRSWVYLNTKLPEDLAALLQADPHPFVQHSIKSKHQHADPDTHRIDRVPANDPN